MKTNYKPTIYACFVGYIVQAIVNNFVPMLFLTFQESYGIPLSKITFLITFNFLLQLAVDLAAAFVADRVGYRVIAVVAHGLAMTGLVSLAVLPEITADPFTGLMISVVIYALGGGLLEVVISPMVEACPTDNKEAAMIFCIPFIAGDRWAWCCSPPCFLHWQGLNTGSCLPCSGR